MHSDDMTKLEKLDWVYWILDEIDQGKYFLSADIQKARDFIQDIRDSYVQDYK